MTARGADVIVVGGGIAGASVAAELAVERAVVLLEREEQPGYHSTGRSAAQFLETYGPPQIRRLTMASRAFFESTVARGFSAAPVLTPRGVLFVARADQMSELDAAEAAARATGAHVERLDGPAAVGALPILDPAHTAGALIEPDAQDLDVDAIHQGYLRAFRKAGGTVAVDAEVAGLRRSGDVWHVETRAGAFEAPIVVNAAGAWADVVGQMAGCAPIGLTPKRRTAILFEARQGPPVAGTPMVVGVAEDFYVKPDAGVWLGSPADATPSEPTDAQPEEIDIAHAIDRIERATVLRLQRLTHSRAGLRSFVADGTPVAGFDPDVAGMYWLAGQGGYGIQTSPALSQFAAAQILGRELPEHLSAAGVNPAALAPDRLR